MEFLENILNQIDSHIQDLNNREIFLIELLRDTYEEDATKAYQEELERINSERKKLFGLIVYIEQNG